MSPALSGSSAIRHFEGSNAIEIRDGITFDFYTGLPWGCHIYCTLKVVGTNACSAYQVSEQRQFAQLQGEGDQSVVTEVERCEVHLT